MPENASAPLISAFQAQLDALLAPAQYPFTGDPDSVRANVRAAVAAIDKADDLLDDAMDDPSRDHDLFATHQEEETLRAAAIAALAPLATGDADRALLARLHGDEDVALSKWTDAEAAYRDALQIVPTDLAALGGVAYAQYELGERAQLVATDTEIVQRAPSSPHYVDLGREEFLKNHSESCQDRIWFGRLPDP